MSHLSARVNRYRNKLKQAGFRPVQLWVLDSRRPGFAEECKRQSQLLNQYSGPRNPDNDLR